MKHRLFLLKHVGEWARVGRAVVKLYFSAMYLVSSIAVDF